MDGHPLENMDEHQAQGGRDSFFRTVCGRAC